MPDEWTREGDPIPEGGREDARRALQRTAYSMYAEESIRSSRMNSGGTAEISIPVLIIRTGFYFWYPDHKSITGYGAAEIQNPVKAA